MGSKIGIIVAGLAAIAGLYWLYTYLSKSNATAKASTPGVLPLTPVNPIPVNLTQLPVWGSPSPVSPSVPTSVTGGAVTSAGLNAVQGPSYSQFLSQQTDASLVGGYSGNLPLSALPPSLVLPDNAINADVVLAGPAGVDPPGISEDFSTYSGTADAFYS